MAKVATVLMRAVNATTPDLHQGCLHNVGRRRRRCWYPGGTSIAVESAALYPTVAKKSE
jgi:hypothetical protein